MADTTQPSDTKDYGTDYLDQTVGNRKVVIAEDFIEHLRAVFDEMYGEIPGLLKGDAHVTDLREMFASLGTDGYVRGTALAKAIDGAGAMFHARLEGYGTLLDSLGYGLMTFLEDSDRVESLNTVTAAELGGYVDYRLGGS